MNRERRGPWGRLVVALESALALVIVAGCGGGDGDGGGGGVTPPPGPADTIEVVAGGNNVPDRYTSDLWVHGNYAYTGTWGASPRQNNPGNVVKIWSLSTAGRPELVDSLKLPNIFTVSDIEVSGDGQLLLFSTEGGSNGGIFLYDLADPRQPAFLDSALVSTGVHTATFGEIQNHRYVFAARNPSVSAGTPPEPALMIFDVTEPSAIALTATVPIPRQYGIHDTYVRDGLGFVFAWNTGVIIYDVGNGMRGGSPSNPQEVSRVVTSSSGTVSPSVHNGWWFHNPVSGEKRYLFVGQEGPGVIGSQSSGDIHVVDVSNLSNPREVASFHMQGAGTHNFWMDEARQILYAAYYNGGIVALDVSGTLSGDLSNRLLAQVVPGGSGNTFAWGVQLANGSLYASDMLSGLWQLTPAQSKQ
jgi:hypothetical protein